MPRSRRPARPSARRLRKLERQALLQTRGAGCSPRRRSSAGSTAGWSSARARSARRSILGDPRSPRMQAQMNIKIKFREGFRPFAPSVLREQGARVLRARQRLAVHAARRAGEAGAPDPDDAKSSESLWGIDKLNVPRSDIPAVTHIDYSARIQTVSRETESRLLRPDPRVRAPHRLCRAGEHVVQRSRRADRLHARGRVPLLHAHAHRLPGARTVPAREDRPARMEGDRGLASRSSSSTDAGRGPEVRADWSAARSCCWRRCSGGATHVTGATVVGDPRRRAGTWGSRGAGALGPVYRGWMALAKASPR